MAGTLSTQFIPTYLFSLEHKGEPLDPLQQVFTRPLYPEQIPVKRNWELFLATVRKRFLIDNLVIRNGLILDQHEESVLEIDDFNSELSTVLESSGFKSRKMSASSFFENTPVNKFGFVVTHNQIPFLHSLHSAKQLLDSSASLATYGMIHQIPSSDDPISKWNTERRINLSSSEWEEYFTLWAEDHAEEGWSYLGNHRGAPGRPRNFVLEKDGSLPFYAHYEEQAMRKLIAELTVANGISASRIPLLLLSFSLAKNNPYLLSGLIGGIHALDAVDGYAARKGFGNSPHGPMIDIYADHITEAITMFEFAYDMKAIPKPVPWVLTARNISTDLLRFINAINTQTGTQQNHPHEGFGTTGKAGRAARLRYGLIKALGDMIIPVIPQSGIYVSAAHIAESFHRALPVWTSPTSQKIYEEFLEKLKQIKNSRTEY